MITSKLRKIGIRIGLLVVILLTGWMLASAVARSLKSRSDQIVYSISGVEEGMQTVVEDHLRNILDKDFNQVLVGATVSDMDILAIEKRLEKEPHISDANVYLDANSKLHIDVDLRKAVMRVMQSGGGGFLLDDTGHKFPVTVSYVPRVIVATGYLDSYTKPLSEAPEKSRLKQVHELVKLIRADEFMNALVEQVHVDDKGDILLIPKIGSHVIVYGKHGADGQERFENLKIFYKEGLPYEGWNKYKTVNIAFKGQVVCSAE